MIKQIFSLPSCPTVHKTKIKAKNSIDPMPNHCSECGSDRQGYKAYIDFLITTALQHVFVPENIPDDGTLDTGCP